MSRIRMVGASLVAIVTGAGAALAADVSVYEPPPLAPAYSPVSAYNWTGPYAGLVGGYGWGSVANRGWIGGAYAGANVQTNSNLVVGVEGDFTFTSKSGANATGTVSNPWNTTLRGRVGYAMNRTLLYGTAGLAVGRLKGSSGYSAAATKVGWTAGLGIETAINDRVTGRVEYRHTNLGTAALSPSVAYKSNDLLFGVGVKF